MKYKIKVSEKLLSKLNHFEIKTDVSFLETFGVPRAGGLFAAEYRFCKVYPQT